MPNTNSLYSTMVRSGYTTYFVDLKEAKNGTKYLTICENNHRPSGETKRVTIRVHGETAPEFSKAIQDAVGAMLA